MNYTYDINTINIYKISKPTTKLSFQIPDANHKCEKTAFKAVEKIYGLNYAIDFKNAWKRATITNDSLIDDLYRNNSKGVPRCKDIHYLDALKFVTNMTRPDTKLKTVHMSGARFYDLNNSGSAELPYVNDPVFIEYIQKLYAAGSIENASLTKGNGRNYIWEKERVKIHQIKEKALPFNKLLHDTRMHGRSHLTKSTDPDKVRAVYGVCCTLIYIEIMILWPLMAIMKESNSFIAWGYETFKGGLLRLKEIVAAYENHFSLDFSTFDKLIPFWLIDDIHAIWKSYYDIGPYYQDDPKYTNPSTSPQRIDALWEFMNFSVKNMIYRAPNGSRYKRRHSGIPSGLLQTQMLGSYANLIMVLSALLSCNINVTDVLSKVLGDDGSYSLKKLSILPQELLDNITKYCKLHFNAIINIDKSTFNYGSENLQFLSYKFYNGAVRRVNDDLIGKLLYPERAHFDIQVTKTRALGIIVANLGYDYYVHMVCLDMLKYLSSVEYSQNGLDWYDKQALTTIFDRFNGIPSRDQLFALARTVDTDKSLSNFRKYIH